MAKDNHEMRIFTNVTSVERCLFNVTKERNSIPLRMFYDFMKDCQKFVSFFLNFRKWEISPSIARSLFTTHVKRRRRRSIIIFVVASRFTAANAEIPRRQAQTSSSISERKLSSSFPHHLFFLGSGSSLLHHKSLNFA